MLRVVRRGARAVEWTGFEILWGRFAQVVDFAVITFFATAYSRNSNTAGTARTVGNRPSGCRDNRFVELLIATLRTPARMWVSAQCYDTEQRLVSVAAGVTPALL